MGFHCKCFQITGHNILPQNSQSLLKVTGFSTPPAVLNVPTAMGKQTAICTIKTLLQKAGTSPLWIQPCRVTDEQATAFNGANCYYSATTNSPRPF